MATAIAVEVSPNCAPARTDLLPLLRKCNKCGLRRILAKRHPVHKRLVCRGCYDEITTGRVRHHRWGIHRKLRGWCTRCHLKRLLTCRHPHTNRLICRGCYDEITTGRVRNRRVGRHQKPKGRCAECSDNRWLNRRHPESGKRVCQRCYRELTGRIRSRQSFRIRRQSQTDRVKKTGTSERRTKIRKCSGCPAKSVYVQHRIAGKRGYFCQACHRRETGWRRPKKFCFRCKRNRRCDYHDWEFEERVCWACHKDHKKLQKVA